MYYLQVFPDEDQLKAVTGEEDLSIEGMVEQESAWLSDSGIGAGDCLELPSENDQPLIDKALERIKEDVEAGDLTAIDELLKFIPKQYLEGFLPEEE